MLSFRNVLHCLARLLPRPDQFCCTSLGPNEWIFIHAGLLKEHRIYLAMIKLYKLTSFTVLIA
jgi:hypothetical protein